MPLLDPFVNGFLTGKALGRAPLNCCYDVLVPVFPTKIDDYVKPRVSSSGAVPGVEYFSGRLIEVFLRHSFGHGSLLRIHYGASVPFRKERCYLGP